MYNQGVAKRSALGGENTFNCTCLQCICPQTIYRLSGKNHHLATAYQTCRALNLCHLRMKWINFYNFSMDMLHTSYYFQHEKMVPRVRYRYRLHEYSMSGKIRIAAG